MAFATISRQYSHKPYNLSTTRVANQWTTRAIFRNPDFPVHFSRRSPLVGMIRKNEQITNYSTRRVICGQTYPRLKRAACYTTSRKLGDQAMTHTLHYNSTSSQKEENNGGSQDDSSQVRHLMRSVPHPVAIVTSTNPAFKSQGITKAWKGATVSSFNTVTLSPEAIISFNIKRVSSTFDAIESSGVFNVHLMTETPEAEEIATRFASGNAASLFEKEDGQRADFIHDEVNDMPDEGMHAPPVIQHFEQKAKLTAAVAFRFLCEYLRDKTVSIGDHVVVFGKVIAIQHTMVGKQSQHTCLSYVHGRYSRISEQ